MFKKKLIILIISVLPVFSYAGHSAVGGVVAVCKAWLTCSSGRFISCQSSGNWCFSNDADNKVVCEAPGAYSSESCN